nr:MAG TPA: hypothetical protein [Caudoviricetes sp.]
MVPNDNHTTKFVLLFLTIIILHCQAFNHSWSS